MFDLISSVLVTGNLQLKDCIDKQIDNLLKDMIPEELVILTKLSVQLNLIIGPRIEIILLQYLEED